MQLRIIPVMAKIFLQIGSKLLNDLRGSGVYNYADSIKASFHEEI